MQMGILYYFSVAKRVTRVSGDDAVSYSMPRKRLATVRLAEHLKSVINEIC
jgi:hypothetical protein